MNKVSISSFSVCPFSMNFSCSSLLTYTFVCKHTYIYRLLCIFSDFSGITNTEMLAAHCANHQPGQSRRRSPSMWMFPPSRRKTPRTFYVSLMWRILYCGEKQFIVFLYVCIMICLCQSGIHGIFVFVGQKNGSVLMQLLLSLRYNV